MENRKTESSTPLTDYEIACIYVSSIQTFAEVGSRADLSKGEVFDLGAKLFDKAIESIKTTRKKLSA
jgi:hypothetical protein